MARGLTRVLCLHREADRGKQVQIKSSAIMYDGITSSQTVEIKGFIHKNIGSPLNSKCLSFDRITEKKFSFKQGFSHFFFPVQPHLAHLRMNLAVTRMRHPAPETLLILPPTQNHQQNCAANVNAGTVLMNYLGLRRGRRQCIQRTGK